MQSYRIHAEAAVYYLTYSIVEWLPVFVSQKNLRIIGVVSYFLSGKREEIQNEANYSRPQAREGMEYEQSSKRGRAPGDSTGAVWIAPPTVSAPPPGAKVIDRHEMHHETTGHLDPRPWVL